MHFFHLLIQSEAEGILDSTVFARALVDLVRKSTTIAGTSDEEATLIELLFEIATKIKLEPDILPKWFYPERDQSRPRDAVNGDIKARKNQFPLFYLLVDFVHHEGPAGDFARLGLLYLTETASKSKPLESWMVESDLAPQMASGLGALYSRLSQTQMGSTAEQLPLIVKHSETRSEYVAETEDEGLQQARKAFLAYLAFWQDTLSHCRSQEVADTLLDHFQVLFVQQLLYPSLLESSDVQGGSTAPVLLHLCSMLDALTNQDLVERVLGYLLACENLPKPQKKARMSISRRKSIDQLTAMLKDDAPPPELFNLLDLIILGLKSESSRTIASTLRLISTIVSKHHCHVIEVLPSTTTMTSIADTSPLLVEVLTERLTGLLTIATEIGDKSTSLDQAYAAILEDIQLSLMEHRCDIASSATPWLLISDCKVLEQISHLIRTFFANDTLVNIGVSGVIIRFAACGRLSLRPWLISTGTSAKTDIVTILSGLIDQIRRFKRQIPEWDRLFRSRKQELEIEPVEVRENPSSPEKLDQRSSSPMPGSFPEGAAASLTSSPRPSTPNRSSITHGRFGSIDGTTRGSPTRSPSSWSQLMSGSPFSRKTQLQDDRDHISDQAELDRVADLKLLHSQITLSPAHEAEATEALPSLTRALQSTSLIAKGLALSESPTTSGNATPDLARGSVSERSAVSLSHVLTNAVILQEFILEITAVIQVRASMFQEVQA